MTQATKRIVDVSEETTIPAPAAAVWAKLCEENSAREWHDRIDTSDEYVDDKGRLTRKFVLHEAEGERIVMYESEILRSDDIMTITYVVEMTVLPITAYHAQIMVSPAADGGSRVVWRSRMTQPDTDLFDAHALVTDFYRTGLAGLARVMAG